MVFHGGKCIENLRLVFEKGKMVESSARKNHDLFVSAMDTHTGDKDRIGELGIGVNHQLHTPRGKYDSGEPLQKLIKRNGPRFLF